MVPRTWTDRLLPLQIQPVPDQLVRVLVGRLEYLTPEVEAAVACALGDLASADTSRHKSARTRLTRLDRFLEPHLRRVLGTSQDEVVRAQAEILLAELDEDGGGR